MKEIRNALSHFLKNTRIEILNGLIVCLTIIFLFLITKVDDLTIIPPNEFKFGGLLISLLLLSLAGLIQVYRKEAPGIIKPIKGNIAIINGWLIFITCFLAVIVLCILHYFSNE